jgi:hypothetical protein
MCVHRWELCAVIFNPFLSRHSRTSVQVLAEQAPTVQHLAHHPA